MLLLPRMWWCEPVPLMSRLTLSIMAAPPETAMVFAFNIGTQRTVGIWRAFKLEVEGTDVDGYRRL